MNKEVEKEISDYTIDELKAMANSGNIQAMIYLGNHYSSIGSGEGISESVVWYEMAAKNDNIFAMHMTVLSKKILAYAGMQIAAEVFGELEKKILLDDWRNVYFWIEKEKECIDAKMPGYERISNEDVVKEHKEISYYLALCCYWADDYDKAKELICGLEEKRVELLQSACDIMLSKNEKEENKAVHSAIKSLINSEYAKSEKSALEEYLYALVALQCAFCYRKSGDKSELQSSYMILEYVYKALKKEKYKELLKDELSHYQKKLLGGYKYVGD